MISNAFKMIYNLRLPLALLTLGVIYVCFIIFIHEDITAGDYQFFAKEPIDLSYGVDRWFGWSSRLLIEYSVNIFSKYLILWNILTIFSGALLLWSLGRIMKVERIYQCILLFCSLLLISVYILTTAGIFATTINYLWPASCFAFAVAVAVSPFKNKLLRRTSTILVLPFFTFAVCSEQLAVLGLMFASTFIAIKIYKKQKVPILLWLLLGLSVAGVLNVFLSPGNDIRRAKEVVAWWPEFDSFSLLYKISLGVVVTLSRLFVAPELPAVVFVFLLGLLSYKMKNISSFVSILPAIIIIILFAFPDTYGSLPSSSRLPNYYNEIGERAIMFRPDNLPDVHTLREYLVVYTAMIVSVVSSIAFLCGKTKKTFLMLGALSAGFIISIAVSLSPTLFASTTRTLFPVLLILVCANYYMFNKLIEIHFSVNQNKMIQ